jgi:hypothetical protein
MKTIKITLSAAPVAVLCFFTWSRSIATERANVIFSIVPCNSTIPIQDVKRSNELRITFWRLVNSGNDNKESYDGLTRKYTRNNKLTGENKAILSYLKKICKDSESFRKFKSLPKHDRITATKLSDISID